MTKNMAKYPTISGDKAIFPPIAAAVINNANTTVGRATLGERTKRSRLNFKKRLERAKRPMTRRYEIAN
jgi:hypothetical protein